MKTGRFLAFSTVGIVIWDIILIYLGALAGQNYASIASTLDATLPIVGYVVVGGAVIFLLILARRRGGETAPASQAR
jgi:membrane protein DedA with SNARE-associated domain